MEKTKMLSIFLAIVLPLSAVTALASLDAEDDTDEIINGTEFELTKGSTIQSGSYYYEKLTIHCDFDITVTPSKDGGNTAIFNIYDGTGGKKTTLVLVNDTTGWTKEIQVPTVIMIKFTNTFVCNGSTDVVNFDGDLSIGSYMGDGGVTWFNLISGDGGSVFTKSVVEGGYETSFENIAEISITNENNKTIVFKATINNFCGKVDTKLSVAGMFDAFIKAYYVWEKQTSVQDWLSSTETILDNATYAEFKGVYHGPSADVPFEGTITNEKTETVPWYVELNIVNSNTKTAIQSLAVNFTENMLSDVFSKESAIDKVFAVLNAVDSADINADNVRVVVGSGVVGLYGVNLQVEDGTFTIKADMVTFNPIAGEKTKFDKISLEGAEIEFIPAESKAENSDCSNTDSPFVNILKNLEYAKIASGATYGSVDITTPEPSEQNAYEAKYAIFNGIGVVIEYTNSGNGCSLSVKTSNNAPLATIGGIIIETIASEAGTDSAISSSDMYLRLSAETLFNFKNESHLGLAIDNLLIGKYSTLFNCFYNAFVTEMTLAVDSAELVSIKGVTINVDRYGEDTITETITSITSKQDASGTLLEAKAGFTIVIDRNINAKPETTITAKGSLYMSPVLQTMIEKNVKEQYPNDKYSYNLSDANYSTLGDLIKNVNGYLIVDTAVLPFSKDVDGLKISTDFFNDKIVLAIHDCVAEIQYSLLGYDYFVDYNLDTGIVKCACYKIAIVTFDGVKYHATEGTLLSSVIPIPEPIDGMIFDHWEYDGKRIDVFVNNIEVSAVYKEAPVTYTIVYDANGGTGTIDAQAVTYGDEKALFADNAFTFGKWQFQSWNTNKDGSGTEYIPGDDASRITSVNGDVVTLYAIWGMKIDVTYGNDSSVIYVEYGKRYSSELDVISSGLTNFKRWYTVDDGQTVTTQSKASSASNVAAEILTAAESKVLVTISVAEYNTVGPVEYSVGVTYASVLDGISIPEVEGFEFKGWYNTADDKPIVMDDTIDSDVKIAALWIAKEYTVTVKVDDGNETEYKCKYDSVFAIPAGVAKEGYAFVSWKVVAGDQTNYLQQGSSIVVRGDVEITPFWGKEGNITVSLVGMGSGDKATVFLNGREYDYSTSKPVMTMYGACDVCVVFNSEEIYHDTTFVEGDVTIEVDVTSTVRTSVIVTDDAKDKNVLSVEGLDQAGKATENVKYTLVVSDSDTEFKDKMNTVLGKDYELMESADLTLYQITADGTQQLTDPDDTNMQTIYIEITADILYRLSMGGYDLGDISVYRSHSGEIETIELGDDTTVGECYYVSADMKYVVLHVNKFSEYGIAIPNNRTIDVTATEGGSASADAKTAEKGDVVTLTYIANAGYSFLYWSVPEGVTVTDNTFVMPDKNVAIKAVFMKNAEPEYYHVTVTTTEGGTASASPIKAQPGTTITLVKTPDKGYHFVKWVSEDVVIENDSFKMPSKNVTVNAVFEKDTPVPVTYHNVTFEFNNGDPKQVVPVQEGKAVAQPTAPSRTGYQFNGWYTDNGDFKKAYDFSTPVTKDITLYAKWTADEPTPEHKDNTMLYVAIAAIVIIAILAVVALFMYKKKSI